MKKDIANEVRKLIDDKINYLKTVATDYAVKYATSDKAEDKLMFQKYDFARECLESIKTPISKGLTNLEHFVEEEV